MHYTHDLRPRVAVSPSFIISQELRSNVVIVNICTGLPGKKRHLLSLFFLAEAVCTYNASLVFEKQPGKGDAESLVKG